MPPAATGTTSQSFHAGLSGRRPDIGSRAVRRLVLIFLAASFLLILLHASKDKLGNAGFSYLGSDVSLEVVETEPEPAPDVFGEYVVPVHREEEEKFNHITTVNATICERRRAEYRQLVDERRPKSALEFTDEGDLANPYYTLAKSQALYSSSCWTNYDRYGHYRDEADAAINQCNALAHPTNRTAVILQLESNNLFTEDAILNMRAIILELGWYHNLDVLILQNVGNHEEYDVEKVPEEFRKLLINFEKVQVFAGYPDQTRATNFVNRPDLNYGGGEFSRYVTSFYQFTQVWFFDRHPEYAFAYFLESHMRSTSGYQDLMTSLLSKIPKNPRDETQTMADLVTLDPVVLTRPSVYWSEKQAALPESYYKSKLVFHGISRRLSMAMKESLESGINALHDAFLPATAVRNKFRVYQLAHPVMKRRDALIFESYRVPESLTTLDVNVEVVGLLDGVNEEGGSGWQHGGTYAADTVRWVDDLKQTQWIDGIYQAWRGDEERCMPGLLVYPVSGR